MVNTKRECFFELAQNAQIKSSHACVALSGNSLSIDTFYSVQ